MKFILNCFANTDNGEGKKDYEYLLKNLLPKLSTNLELDSLEYIIVPESFGKELNKF